MDSSSLEEESIIKEYIIRMKHKKKIGDTAIKNMKLNMKVKVIEIKHYQLKNILIKLDHT